MNEKFNDILKLARVELVIIPIFILLKYIRPYALASELSDFFKILLLSLPNFFEAIIGTISLTGIFLILNDQLNKRYQIKVIIIYTVAVTLAGIYVFAQELKIIKLRRNTTFDPNDLIFSVIGLIIGFLIISLIKPRIQINSMLKS